MKSTDRELEIQNLELRLAAVHDKMDALEEESMHLTNKIILAKKQQDTYFAQQQGELNV